MNRLSDQPSGETRHGKDDIGESALHNNNDNKEAPNAEQDDSLFEMFKIPDGNGLLLRLDNAHGRLYVEQQEKDGHFGSIHPNCFAPASLSNVVLLKGGGSGTAVFSGYYPALKSTVVMKHAGYKDTQEVMSLAGIHEQLLLRGGRGGGGSGRGGDSMQSEPEMEEEEEEDLLRRQEAASFLVDRIPQFLFCYISPRHVRDREMEHWKTLRDNSLRDIMAEVMKGRKEDNRVHDEEDDDEPAHRTSFGDVAFQAMKAKSMKRDIWICRKNQSSIEPDEHGLMKIRTGSVLLQLPEDARLLHSTTTSDASNHLPVLVLERDGCYKFLDKFTRKLAHEQERHAWKCTLAQSLVGHGRTSRNGAMVLLSGQLQGSLLHNTIEDFIQVMRCLRQLSSPQERRGTIHVVRREVRQLEAQVKEASHPKQQHQQPLKQPASSATTTTATRTTTTTTTTTHVVTQVSTASNEFAGASIRKNFLPREGRLAKLLIYGEQFRQATSCMSSCGTTTTTTATTPTKTHHLVLLDNEKIPASILGRLLQQSCPLSTVFVNPPAPFGVLDFFLGPKQQQPDDHCFWLRLLQLATSFDSHEVNDCIWTCGLTDAGLHNAFVSTDRGLELFDLGPPQLMPMPAFLTKFLMSFFHVLGMEDADYHPENGSSSSSSNDATTKWVCRFETTSNRSPFHRGNHHHHNNSRNKNEDKNNDDLLLLSLTRATKAMLPKIQRAFEYTVNQMIHQVFGGDERVRELLITYTTLQLVSDACFCIDRWDQKGGGRERLDDRRTTQLDMWLWRSIWDLYIASHLCQTMIVPLLRQPQQPQGHNQTTY